MAIGLANYLTVAAILFTIGVLGIFLNRKNIIIILMSVELILLAVNINFVAFSAYLGDLVGQVFALFVLTVAAAEAAIGLAILVVYFRNRGTIAVEDVNHDEGLSDVRGHRLPSASGLGHRRAVRPRHRRARVGTRHHRAAVRAPPRCRCVAFNDVALAGPQIHHPDPALDSFRRFRGGLDGAGRHPHGGDAGGGDGRVVAGASLFHRLHGTKTRTGRASSPICRCSPSPC